MDAATIRTSITIPTVLRQHGVDWPEERRRGACPFHAGSNPQALSLRSDGLVGYCHACGWKGSAIDAEMRLGRCGIVEALRRLAEAVGPNARHADGVTVGATSLRMKFERNARVLAAITRAYDADRNLRWVGLCLAHYRRTRNGFGIARVTARLQECADEQLAVELALDEMEALTRK